MFTITSPGLQFSLTSTGKLASSSSESWSHKIASTANDNADELYVEHGCTRRVSVVCDEFLRSASGVVQQRLHTFT